MPASMRTTRPAKSAAQLVQNATALSAHRNTANVNAAKLNTATLTTKSSAAKPSNSANANSNRANSNRASSDSANSASDRTRLPSRPATIKPVLAKPVLAKPLLTKPSDGASVGLEQTIEGEVIPRLMLALLGARPSDAFAPLMPTTDDIEVLSLYVMGRDDGAGQTFVDELRVRGMALEMIYLHLLAPTARQLGDMWKQDTVDFTDVTIGLGRLHKIVRRLSPSFRLGRGTLDDRAAVMPVVDQRRALIAPASGDQHTFGCIMVEDFFTRAGWDVMGWPVCADTGLIDLVRNHTFDLVGLSVGCDTRLGSIEQEIAALRRASRNRSLLVMVGGRTFTEMPSLAREVGADGTGSTGADAVQTAELMMTKHVVGA